MKIIEILRLNIQWFHSRGILRDLKNLALLLIKKESDIGRNNNKLRKINSVAQHSADCGSRTSEKRYVVAIGPDLMSVGGFSARKASESNQRKHACALSQKLDNHNHTVVTLRTGFELRRAGAQYYCIFADNRPCSGEEETKNQSGKLSRKVRVAFTKHRKSAEKITLEIKQMTNS